MKLEELFDNLKICLEDYWMLRKFNRKWINVLVLVGHEQSDEKSFAITFKYKGLTATVLRVFEDKDTEDEAQLYQFAGVHYSIAFDMEVPPKYEAGLLRGLVDELVQGFDYAFAGPKN
jgi:hypothetical protein